MVSVLLLSGMSVMLLALLVLIIWFLYVAKKVSEKAQSLEQREVAMDKKRKESETYKEPNYLSSDIAGAISIFLIAWGFLVAVFFEFAQPVANVVGGSAIIFGITVLIAVLIYQTKLEKQEADELQSEKEFKTSEELKKQAFLDLINKEGLI